MSKYPTDLSDAERAYLKPCLPAPKKRGRRRPNVHSPRKTLNAVFYLLKRAVPGDFYLVASRRGRLSTIGSVGGEHRGYDGGKKVRGRKRHLLVDTEGLVLKAKVHSAKVPTKTASSSC